ncbi:unnamed protein product [Angiostrongylus costaricensis]|uniref:Na_H_Exchanger domain-containing protein n=1 Tax=Angiostrongylus costaricensis TaxID=334426 RepID=A0A0R3PGI9_ANGCS|nr:unnamed protein product [Angiostrongylus costaricensis]
MNAVNHAFPGIVACLLACFVAPSRWRTDNPKRIEPIATFFAYTWYYVASPLLFSLVGTLLDFTEIPGDRIFAAIVLVIVGVLARLASGFAVVICSPLSLGEQFVVVWSLVPKATVQAALGPNLLAAVEGFPQFKEDATFVVASCILTVAITAPIGAVILDLVAPRVMRKAPAHTNQVAAGDQEVHKKSLPTIVEECRDKPSLRELELAGVHEILFNSVMKCNIDIRKNLCPNTTLTGGNTLFPGLSERMDKELTALIPRKCGPQGRSTMNVGPPSFTECADQQNTFACDNTLACTNKWISVCLE